MKIIPAIILTTLLLNCSPGSQAAAKPATVARNLDWAALTLDKIEKDLAEVTRDHKLSEAATLTAGFASARNRLAALRTAAAASTADSDATARVVEFTRNIGNLAQSVLDHVNDQDSKRDAFRKLIDDNPSLEKTDLGKRFATGIRSLVEDLVRMAALQLEDKPVEAAQADGAWNLDALRMRSDYRRRIR